MTSLNGSALVTGASRGLGAVIALQLASMGYPVAVNYRRSADEAHAVVEQIEQRGGAAVAVGADVTEPGDVAGMTAEIEQTLGPMAVVVINATPPQRAVRVEDVRWQADVEPLMQAFVHSPLLITQAVVPGMIALGGGRIIHITSDVVDRLPLGTAPTSRRKRRRWV